MEIVIWCLQSFSFFQSNPTFFAYCSTIICLQLHAVTSELKFAAICHLLERCFCFVSCLKGPCSMLISIAAVLSRCPVQNNANQWPANQMVVRFTDETTSVQPPKKCFWHGFFVHLLKNVVACVYKECELKVSKSMQTINKYWISVCQRFIWVGGHL